MVVRRVSNNCSMLKRLALVCLFIKSKHCAKCTNVEQNTAPGLIVF